MSRPPRSERLATKGRPKRRAAAKTHFFKYQLANNPSRAEENDLKRALQESLEEQHYTSPRPSNGKSKQYINNNNNHNNNNNNNIRNNSNSNHLNSNSNTAINKSITSSANSSDVSSRSNNSGTSNESVGYILLNANNSTVTPKRTRSNTSSLLNLSPVNKRARINGTNGHQNKCDGDTNVSVINLQQTPTPPPSLSLSQKAIKTYSRSHPNNLEALKQKNKQNQADNSTMSSTPIRQSPSSSSTTTTINTTGDQIIKPIFETNSPSIGRRESHKQYGSNTNNTSVSKGTQTANLGLKSNCSKPIASTEVNKINEVNTLAPSMIKQNQKKNFQTEKEMPNRDTYLKFKRESKNYAYVKMTALKVSTQKSPSSNSKASSINKKSSPNGVLNNNSTNQDTPTDRTSSQTNGSLNGRNSSASGHSKKPADDSINGQTSDLPSKKGQRCDININLPKPTATRTDGKKSPVDLTSSSSSSSSSSASSSQKASPHNSKALDKNKISKSSESVQGSQVTTAKNDPKHLLDVDIDVTSEGCKNDYSTDDTRDLSKNKNQNQANDVKVIKKRLPQGSWSLLGVPEEKIIYLKDDEAPKRLICYPAIKHVEGDVIQVRDSVLLRSGARKTDLPYIAKLCAFWEDAETGGVMMSLFWYYRPEHTEEGRKPHNLSDEIFASRHRDVDSVECIDDKCYVLTFNEYCRYRKRCKMEQVNTTWSLTDVTIPLCNESYPRRNRIPDSDVNPELVFCCRQIYDSRTKRLVKNPLINTKYGNI